MKTLIFNGSPRERNGSRTSLMNNDACKAGIYHMGYLISAYFDRESNRTLSRYIREIARAAGNDFMVENMVPPHLTVSFFEAPDEESAKTIFREIQGDLKPGEILIPSAGAFFPNVIYAEAVQNAYLFELSNAVNEVLKRHDEVKVSRYYRHLSWIPHVTLGKTLDPGQMRAAFEYLQKHFSPLTVKAERFGLAKTNPHREILSTGE